MTLPIIALLPLLTAWLPAVLVRRGRNACAWAAAAIAAAAALFLLRLAPGVFSGEAIEAGWPWIPALGLNASFRLDGLALLFALLILSFGLLVTLYARYYLSERDPIGRFYSLLLLFMGSMLGIVLSGNLLLMLMFWELTSLSSFLLIGYWHNQSDARQGARMALMITGAGGLALLGGVVLLGYIVGSFDLSVILDSGEQVRNHPLYPATLVLILLGAFTKSAQFPFHFWLPHAMAAPTPVSAYLHSATMVKAGIYLLIRLWPLFAGSETFYYVVNGFISKEMFLTETLAVHTSSLIDRLLPVLATVGSAFSVIYSVRFIHQVFFGRPSDDLPHQPHEPVAWMRLPVELLAVACLVVGILPALSVGGLLDTAARSVLGDATPTYSLAIWHGLTPALLLSFVALAGGGLVYFVFRRQLGSGSDEGPPWAGRLRARRVFDLTVAGLHRLAALAMRVFSTRRLQPQMLLLLLVAIFAGVSPFALSRLAGGSAFLSLGSVTTRADPVYVVVWVLAAACAAASAYVAKFQRLAALILMGGTGLMSCLTFVWLSAPDLAVTQLLVESVTTVLLLLGLRWLPKRVPLREETAMMRLRAGARRARDLAVAITAGAGVALLAYAAMTMPAPDGISSSVSYTHLTLPTL